MAAHAGAVPVQTAIDRIGFGRFQKRLLGVCGVTWAADAAEIFIIAFALPKITEDFGLSTFQSSVVVASTFVGMLAGAWFWGTVSDRIGRKRGFTITIGIFALFGFLSAFSPNMFWLCAFRILAGFGLGGAVPLDFSLFAEYLPTRNRGRWLVILESFWGVGTVVAAGLAWILVPTLGWRYLLGSSAVAGALVFWVRLRIPESPRFLAATGRVDEAEAILGQVARENGVPEQDVPRIVPPADASDKVEIKRLFEGKLARTTVMLWSTWFFIALAYYGLFSWLPKIFAERGFDVVQTYGYTLLLAAAQLPGYFSAAWLVERWGRKRTFVTYLSIAALCTFVYGTATSLTVLIAAALLMSFFALGAWSSLYAYTPELLPTRMRTTGMGAASGMARVAGVLAPLIGGVLIPVSLGLTLTVYALAFALAALSVAVLGHETRDEALADTVAEEEGEPVYRGGRFVRTTARGAPAHDHPLSGAHLGRRRADVGGDRVDDLAVAGDAELLARVLLQAAVARHPEHEGVRPDVEERAPERLLPAGLPGAVEHVQRIRLGVVVADLRHHAGVDQRLHGDAAARVLVDVAVDQHVAGQLGADAHGLLVLRLRRDAHGEVGVVVARGQRPPPLLVAGGAAAGRLRRLVVEIVAGLAQPGGVERERLRLRVLGRRVPGGELERLLVQHAARVQVGHAVDLALAVDGRPERLLGEVGAVQLLVDDAERALGLGGLLAVLPRGEHRGDEAERQIREADQRVVPEADEVRAAPDEQHVVDALHPLAAHVALVLPRELRDPVEVPGRAREVPLGQLAALLAGAEVGDRGPLRAGGLVRAVLLDRRPGRSCGARRRGCSRTRSARSGSRCRSCA